MFKRIIMGTVKSKMGKQKDKWYETYRISTSLNLEEVEERIKSKTALHFAGSMDGFWFFGKEKDIKDGKFRLYVSTNMVPPRGKNPYLPDVRGKIVADAKGNSIVFVWLELPVGTVIFDFVLYTYFLWAIKGNVLVYAFFLWLAAFLLMKYWEFARRRIGEKLENLLADDKKATE